jgi:hypothetical protein
VSCNVRHHDLYVIQAARGGYSERRKPPFLPTLREIAHTRNPVPVGGQLSMLSARSWPQCWQITNKPRTLCGRMLPTVIGRIGASSLAMPLTKNRQGRNQVAVIGSSKRTNVAQSDLHLWDAIKSAPAIVTAATRWLGIPCPLPARQRSERRFFSLGIGHAAGRLWRAAACARWRRRGAHGHGNGNGSGPRRSSGYANAFIWVRTRGNYGNDCSFRRCL